MGAKVIRDHRPAGRTAYLFDQMRLEAAPWFLTLVPAS